MTAFDQRGQHVVIQENAGADEKILAQGIWEKMEWLAETGRVSVMSHEDVDDLGETRILWSVKWENSYCEDKVRRVRYTMEDSLHRALNRAIEGLMNVKSHR